MFAHEKSALDFAKEHGHMEVVEYLQYREDTSCFLGLLFGMD